MKESKELFRRVNQILFEEWDPISVSDNDDLRDEYESYVPKIITLLLNNANEDEIADMLLRIEKENMGFKGQKRDMETAQKLVALRV